MGVEDLAYRKSHPGREVTAAYRLQITCWVISPGAIEKHEKSTVREFCLGRPLEQRSLEGFCAEHSAQGGWSLSARRGIEPQVRVPRPWILPARRGSNHLEKGTSNARAAV